MERSSCCKYRDSVDTSQPLQTEITKENIELEKRWSAFGKYRETVDSNQPL